MTTIPLLDLSLASDLEQRETLLEELYHAFFNVGFLFIKNHGIPQEIIDDLVERLPQLFCLPADQKLKVSKLNSPHFLGYNGYAEESTLGQKDLREQFDFATELPMVYDPSRHDRADAHNMAKLYWRLRGPNQWPDEEVMPGFREALTNYHDAVSDLSYRFVHLIEEAFGIPIGTFDHFFAQQSTARKEAAALPPQHRIKLLHYPPIAAEDASTQGVGPHKDSSGWLTFLYQPPHPEGGLEVLSQTGSWLPAPAIPGTFVVNIGNAFEAATEGALRATIHKVEAPRARARYSVPFFMGLPLDLTVSQIRGFMPEAVRKLGRERGERDDGISAFLDPRWDGLGESQLRKWIRSHEDVGRKWYGDAACEYYLS